MVKTVLTFARDSLSGKMKKTFTNAIRQIDDDGLKGVLPQQEPEEDDLHEKLVNALIRLYPLVVLATTKEKIKQAADDAIKEVLQYRIKYDRVDDLKEYYKKLGYIFPTGTFKEVDLKPKVLEWFFLEFKDAHKHIDLQHLVTFDASS